jgi:hypothetical protein
MERGRTFACNVDSEPRDPLPRADDRRLSGHGTGGISAAALDQSFDFFGAAEARLGGNG